MSRTVLFLSLVLLVSQSLSFVHFGDWTADMNPQKWRDEAQTRINEMLTRKVNKNVAKNILFFLGDGMGISTVTAGRILKGQLEKRAGEEEVTHMESLDYSGFAKTYNIDAQTADSAGTATAYLSGVKTRIGVIGVDGTAIYGNCKSSLNAHVDSILQWAHKAGKSVGIVTTTRITHATPAGTYAHVPHRDWEYFGGRFGQSQYDEGCRDISQQLIKDHPYINVIIGGGRDYFLSTNDRDPCGTKNGLRTDGKNLINDWTSFMTDKKLAHKFVCNAADFRNVDPNNVDYLLALMAPDHLEYELKRNNSLEPSISELTEKAIKILSKNPNGFFLLVEGGKIDHGHHESKAQCSLRDFVAFDEAIGKGLSLTDERETTTLVTADHSHTFSIGGYAYRGNLIYGLLQSSQGNLSEFQTLFTSLIYANGPGGLKEIRKRNLTDEEVADPDYKQEAAVYLKSETHGGEDVPVYVHGPMSYMFSGTFEQSFIPHALAYASCIGKYDTDECRKNRGTNDVITTQPPSSMPSTTSKNAGTINTFTMFNSMFIIFILFFIY